MPNLIDHWLAEGLITPPQADRMRADLTTPAGPAPARNPDAANRTSLVVEALAYLGGVIVLVAAGLIGAQYWRTLSEVGQLTVVGGAATVILLAGIAVRRPRSAVQVRLRSVLWMLATAGAGAFLALFADRVLELDGDAIALTASSGAAVLAGVLWWRLPILTQQSVFFVAMMVAAGAAVAQLTTGPHLPGLAVWGTGLIWFLLGARGTVKPRRPVLALAGAGALVGAAMTLPADAGMVLALCTVVSVVVVAVAVRDLLLLAVGAIGALNILPAVVSQWFPGQLAAPLVLLVVGALLVAAAVYTATVRGKS
ncbi:MAG TPA: DUF2157 domain-containing protein [Kribbella sp.]|nr:DUF2157 domain-containing protein [Kribbella sp.]